MGRILTALLAFHWMAVFALAAGTGLAGEATASAWPNAVEAFGVLGISAAYGLVAVLFLWTLVSAFIAHRDRGDMADVARFALGGAVAALTLDLVLNGIAPVSRDAVPYAVQIAALMGTYLVIQADRWQRPEEMASRETVNATARLMALGAARRSMVDHRVARVVAANDERRR